MYNNNVRKQNAIEKTFNPLLVEFLERADQHAQNVEIHNQVTLPEDLIFKILLLLPARFLLRIQLVCKKWFDLINSSFFITCHAKQSETVLITQTLYLRNPNPKPDFHVLDLDCTNDKYVKSMTLDIFHIFASYDGVVLARMEENSKSLTLINPITRKRIQLPLGTCTLFANGMYSLTFCKKDKSYKVVHLFCNERRSLGCEILNISTKTWKKINNLVVESSQSFRQTHVSIGGSLFWVLQKNGIDYLVVMNVQDEKFTTKKLPTVCTGSDRLVEIGGVLGFVAHPTHHMMQVWILDEHNENWIKRHEMYMKFGLGYSPVPIYSRNGKEIVFVYMGGHHLYAYNLDEGEMKVVYSIADVEAWHFEHMYTPHRNTLASWEDQSL